MSEPPAVLDASALLALLQDEPGAATVAARMPNGVMSAVNLSEVVAKLADHGVPAGELRAVLDGLNIDVRDFDAETAYIAGELHRTTRQAGLSFGDRACLALAIQLGAVAITADRTWTGLNGDRMRIDLIR